MSRVPLRVGPLQDFLKTTFKKPQVPSPALTLIGVKRWKITVADSDLDSISDSDLQINNRHFAKDFDKFVCRVVSYEPPGEGVFSALCKSYQFSNITFQLLSMKVSKYANQLPN